MAILIRILNVLILLGAIAAAVFSYLLFERRGEFRGRADKLAETLAEVTATLDTKASEKISFTPATADTPESGSLGWKAYHEAKGADKTYADFNTPLEAAKKIATEVGAQRETLVDSLVDVGTTLGIPQGQIEPEAIKSHDEPEAYKKATETIVGEAKRTAARDSSMIQTLTACARTIGQPLSENDLKQATEPTLSKFANEVTQLNTRSNDYGKLLTDAIRNTKQHKWKTNPAAVTDPKTYKTAMKTLEQDFGDINNKLVQLSKTQAEISALKSKLEDLSDELKMTQEDLQKEKHRVTQLQGATGSATTGPTGVQIQRPRVEEPLKPVDVVSPTLEGKVLQVNKDWNFVILDLGYDKLKEGTDMLVAREEDFIARVKITKVLRKISIAEVLPELQTGGIKVDDRVIMPRED